MEQRGTGTSVIELTGNRSAVVDGCEGVVDYGPEEIVLRSGRLTVRFVGKDLRLRRLTESSAVIEGWLEALYYQR